MTDVFWNFIWKYHLIIFRLTRKLGIWRILHSLGRMFRWCLRFIISIQKCSAVQLSACQLWVRKCWGNCIPAQNESARPGLFFRGIILCFLLGRRYSIKATFTSVLFPYICREDLYLVQYASEKPLALLLIIVRSCVKLISSKKPFVAFLNSSVQAIERKS